MQTNGRFRVGVVADDLTSAADGAGPFVARGLRAMIGRRRLAVDGCDVFAVDSGSRSLSIDDAARNVAALTTQLASSRVLYKTVDSTLRGHVTAELAAAFSNSRRKTLVFAPAFPAAGRTTVRGIQYVDGVPVSESSYGRDPVHPARTSSLAELVPGGIGEVVILDAATQDELNAKVAGFDDPCETLWVGSPGMAEALAARLAGIGTSPTTPDTGTGGILVAIGTANPLSHRQADGIESLVDVTVLRGPRDRQTDPAGILDGIANRAARLVRTGCIDLLVATGGDTLDAILDRLGVDTFELLAELEPGFPLGRATLAGGSKLMIAMKAGGFGDDDTLRRVFARLRHETFLTRRALP